MGPITYPIIVLISDGVPNVDLDELVYINDYVQDIEVYDGNGDPYTSAEVATTGDIFDSIYYSYKPAGAVVADVMDEIVELKASLPDATIHTVAVGGDGFNAEVLQYVAEMGGGDYYAANNAADLTAQLSALYNSISCASNP